MLIGRNVEAEVKNGVLYLAIPLGEKGMPSSTGKTEVVATTEGNKSIPGMGDLKLGLTMFRPIKAAA